MAASAPKSFWVHASSASSRADRGGKTIGWADQLSADALRLTRTKVFLACLPIDLRAGFDGPGDNVQQIIGVDPFSSYVFSELMPWAYQSPTGEAAG
jgi:hypothetical protein